MAPRRSHSGLAAAGIVTILGAMGLFEEQTEQSRLRHKRDIEIAKIKANPNTIAAEAAAEKEKFEAQAALVRVRGENFDTELTLIAEANKPALAQVDAYREMNRNLVKLGALAITAIFLAAVLL